MDLKKAFELFKKSIFSGILLSIGCIAYLKVGGVLRKLHRELSERIFCLHPNNYTLRRFDALSELQNGSRRD